MTLFRRLFPSLLTQIHCYGSIASVRQTRIVRQEDVDRFAKITGDTNFIHSIECSREDRCIHGALLNGFISGIIGTKLPGPGAIVIKQTFKFPNKCVIDEEIEIIVDLIEDRKIKKIAYEIKQKNVQVFSGTADVIISKKIK